ncbi:energy transducer TonB [uncultured Roseovarius sp.]|uniref:energy transducer TonB n=1 Tax=uncultured Roseovarius sp. TaxID=293344 RepID=UPI002610A8EE|nr:energy transducer TonB [uncultured Roseovarius sp.]
MNTGQIISGAGHLALIGWALLGGVFKSEPLPFEVTEVTAISGEEYAALIAPQEAPETAMDVTTPEAPEVEDTAPDLGSEADASPEVSQPDVAETTSPDESPEVTEVMPPAEAEVSDEAPELTPPSEDVAVMVPEPAEKPKPRPVERVAPEPVAQPEPDTQVDDVAQPETVPDETSETPREETDATAPEEAATEIVTEADEPEQAAPSTSRRPKSRPPRSEPVETVDTAQEEPAPQEPKTDNSSVNDALAEALGGGGTGAAAPSGPPMTRGEKDALRVAVKQCWNVGSLSTDALQVTVVVTVKMGEDGKPISVNQLSATGGSGAAVNKAYEAARRAVLRCGAKGFDLPRDKYDHWRDIEMTFNPEKMRIK